MMLAIRLCDSIELFASCGIGNWIWQCAGSWKLVRDGLLPSLFPWRSKLHLNRCRSSSSCCYLRPFNPPDRNVYALLCGYHRKIINLLLRPVAGKCNARRESCGLFRVEKDQSLHHKKRKGKKKENTPYHNYCVSLCEIDRCTEILP